ncbi:unnamed protein product [Soboliphyme baturini]|uniref:Tetraspanin n=1 Tax=Soboliphyme baturini TaxID=241478 RepID=A0A183IE37_9BILA|nr:unnamed protein product [Soboliphyme baturini]
MVLGCGSFGVGIWLYVVKADYTSIAAPNFGALSAAALYVAAGATIIVIGFVGCCGAWVESKCLLITYFVFVLLVFVVELTAGILAFLYKREVRQLMISKHFYAIFGECHLEVGRADLRRWASKIGVIEPKYVSEVIRIELRNNLQNPYVAERARDSNGLPVTWDSLQSQFKCCGVESYKDWFRSERWPQNNWVLDSCCDPAHFKSTDSMENCGKLGEQSLLFQRGCYEAFTDWLLEHMHVVGIIGILLSFIQVLVTS